MNTTNSSSSSTSLSNEGNFPISCIEFEKSGPFYSSDAQGKVSKRDTTSARACSFQPHTKGINDMYVFDDHDLMVTVSDDHLVVVSEKQELKAKCSHSEHQAPVTCVTSAACIFPVVMSGGYDENLIIFNANTEQVIQTLPAHADPVTDVAFSSDGRLFASCSYDGLVRVWDARGGRVLKSMIGDTNPAVTGVLFHDDGKSVVASCLDSSLKFWDLRTATLVKTCSDHKNSKYIIRPRWAGPSTIAMGSEDGKVYLYGQDVQTLQLFPLDDPCLNVAVSHELVLAGSGLKSDLIKFIKL